MDFKDVMAFMAFMAIVFIPALAITARFALKPIVESIVRLREAFSAGPKQPAVADPDQLRLLQQEVSDLRVSVEHLRDVVEFERALKKPESAPQITASRLTPP
ncbi:MAG TPA: hypothetical protein VF021_00905 [Longimicrobiales bacterium]